MLIVVDAHSGVPVYRQLMDQIRFHIASGLLAPGEELPSTRTLSADLGINPMTISKAYSLLERDRIVERRPGRPLVVAELADGELRDHKTEQLREHLAPIVTIARQLGIDDARALETFRALLEAEPAKGRSKVAPDLAGGPGDSTSHRAPGPGERQTPDNHGTDVASPPDTNQQGEEES